MRRARVSCGLGLGLLLSGVVFSAPLRAENYAFLVAVQDYDVKDLKKLSFTRSDIEEFGKVLRKSGFRPQNIVVLNDKAEQARYMAESGKIRTEFDLVLAGVESGDTLIVAFSGHGVQFEGEDKNYYCPLDANLDDPKRASLIPLSEIYDKLKQCPAEKKLLLVDACRNDPLSPLKKSRATVNLKSVTRPQTEPVPKGVVALFSCSAGQESFEWPDLKHGIFFHHVLEGWNGAAAEDGKQVTLDALVSYSRKRTQEFARLNLKAVQTPQMKSEFEGTWILRTLTTPDLGGTTKPSSPPPSSEGTSTDVPEGSAKGITNNIGMKLVLIPKGEFQMGSPESEENRGKDEAQHRVQITESFYLGKFEVTQAEFQKVMGRNPSWFSSSGGGKDKVSGLDTERCPVEQVSWYDAVEFCNKLSGRNDVAEYYRLTNIERNGDESIKKADVTIVGGVGYRLPTEAEWEYACRAGSTTPFHFGTENNGQEANVDGNDPYGTTTKGPYLKRTTSVGRYAANRLGLHDMHGNVWEWCQDWYDEKYYGNSPGEDPHGPNSGTSRVLRGGSWNFIARLTRSARRLRTTPDYRNGRLGFRVAAGGPVSRTP